MLRAEATADVMHTHVCAGASCLLELGAAAERINQSQLVRSVLAT